MKLRVIACGLLASFLSASVLADASSDLQQRLNKVNSFHASFSQKVTDGSGANVQDGEGELWVKRPSLFSPDGGEKLTIRPLPLMSSTLWHFVHEP